MMDFRGAVTYAVTYKGWRMVLIGFVCVVFGFGATTGSLPVIYGEAIDEFGWTHTQGVMIFSFKNLSSAAMALFFIGPLIQKLGLKTVMASACLFTSAGMLAFLWIDSFQGYCLAGLLIGIGVMPVLIASEIFVSRWFTRNQGLAIGIVVSGVSVGGVIFPVLVSVLIDAFGWRIAFASLSMGIIFVVLPLYLWLANDEPDDLDVLPDSAVRNASPEITNKIRTADLDTTFSGLLKTLSFWLIAISIFAVSAADSAVLQHTVLFLEREVGLDRTIAAASMSAMFGLGLIAKIGAGKLFDIFSIRGIMAWYFFMAVSIMLALTVQGAITLILFAAARGLAHGGFISEAPVIAKHCFGPRLMNYALPVFTGAFAIGNVIGPPVTSLSYDILGSYSYGFSLAAVACIISAALLVRIQPTYRMRLLEIGR